MPDDTFRALFDETADLDWATTDRLRHRAGQRRRRQRFAAGAAAAAVVAVVAAGAAFAIDRGPAPEPVPPASPAPSVSQSTTPSPSSGLGSATGSPSGSGGSSSSSAPAVVVTTVPLSAMLTVGDGGGSGWTRDEDPAGGDWKLAYAISLCPANGGTFVDDIDTRLISLSGPNDRNVVQDVRAYQSAAAARNSLNWVRGNVNRCASFTVDGQQYKMSIVASGVAGDESFIVKSVGYEGQETFRAFVREGNLVTEISPGGDSTQSRASSLAVKAAARMCVATKTC